MHEEYNKSVDGLDEARDEPCQMWGLRHIGEL